MPNRPEDIACKTGNPDRLIIKAAFLFVMIALLPGCANLHELFKPTPLGPDDLFDWAQYIIEKKYVDKSGDPIKLDTSMRPDIRKLIAQLDPFSVYVSSEEKALLLKSSEIGSVGIGLNFHGEPNDIQTVYLRSPALRAGIRKGDKIIEIDDASVAGLSSAKLMEKLQGTPGSVVTLKISRPKGEEKIFRLTREILKPIKPAAIMNDKTKIAYLRIEGFGAYIPNAIKSEVKRLQEQQAKGLILDVRNNDGGLLTSVVETAQVFLPRSAPICTVGGRKDRQEKVYRSGGWSHETDLPLIVLVDNKTINAAEIFAAALGDNKRALLVGEQTAGLFEIYTTYTLKNGALLRIKTGSWYGPFGAEIDGNGVKPDKAVVLTEEARAAIYDKMETTPEGYRGDYEQDLQIKTAVDMLTGGTSMI